MLLDRAICLHGSKPRCCCLPNTVWQHVFTSKVLRQSLTIIIVNALLSRRPHILTQMHQYVYCKLLNVCCVMFTERRSANAVESQTLITSKAFKWHRAFQLIFQRSHVFFSTSTGNFSTDLSSKSPLPIISIVFLFYIFSLFSAFCASLLLFIYLIIGHNHIIICFSSYWVIAACRKANFASAVRICYGISVCLTICPSHSGIVSKPGNAEWCGLHSRVASLAQCL